MFKFMFLFALLSQAFAGTELISANPLMSEQEGVKLLLEKSESETKRFVFRDGFKKPATRGDFVILWGVGASTANQKITEDEYKGLWRVMNYLSSTGFRVIMNFRSTGEDLKLAAESATSSVILFSGHGNKTAFYDWDEKPVDFKVFEKASKSLYQFILSACEGRVAMDDNYVIPKRIQTYGWTGLTNSTELINFLVGDSWTGLERGKE
ncbi:MAG: hypothetical protein V4598_00530 [Bdellovibrionota bacterium]